MCIIHNYLLFLKKLKIEILNRNETIRITKFKIDDNLN